MVLEDLVVVKAGEKVRKPTEGKRAHLGQTCQVRGDKEAAADVKMTNVAGFLYPTGRFARIIGP